MIRVLHDQLKMLYMCKILQHLEKMPKECMYCGDVTNGLRRCYKCRYRKEKGLRLYGKGNPLKTIDGIEYE